MALAEGLVTKTYCGYYQVYSNEQFYRCRVRGKLGKQQVATGDYVVFIANEDLTGTIEKIKPRQFYLNRPPIANINQVLLVFSAVDPVLDFFTIDKFLLEILQENVKVVLCINKADLVDASFAATREFLKAYEKMGVPVVLLSTKSKLGIPEVCAMLDGHITAMIGPSGVGKTSLLNLLKADLNLKVGEVSEKIKRGKHTTRFVELVQITGDTWIVDSPGFSFVEHTLKAEELAGFYPDFTEYYRECKFADCMHLREPHCGIKSAVDRSDIAKFRYDTYVTIIETLIDKERNKYR